MSKESRENVKRGKAEMQNAKDHARMAKEYFKYAGDSDGEKKADAIEKVANEGVEYVEKKLGKD